MVGRSENGGKKGQGGVGQAVRTSITRAARPPEFISDRLLKVILELRGRAKAVTFFVAYAPFETQNASNKHVDILDELGQSCGGGTQTRTAVLVDGCQRPHGEEGEGTSGEKG